MQKNDAKGEWERFVASERARIAPYLARHGFALDDEQPQTIGERYLTRPLGGARKVVFFGRRVRDGLRVVIKASSEPKGVAELAQERRARLMLDGIKFAYQTFFSPAELRFDPGEGVLITEYIEQGKPFLERTLKEQFAIALRAFKAQEGAHATAASHLAALRKLSAAEDSFIQPDEYKKIGTYTQDLAALEAEDAALFAKLAPLLDRTIELIREHAETLERYGGFLTHWDFIPQNFRIRADKLYLLDHSSIRFGNKYEGWARFVNFMTLYNPPLADALVAYVRLNRAEEESLALKLMRAYRLVELIRYYASWLGKTGGDDRELALARIAFWSEALRAVLDDARLPAASIEAYKKTRDRLRSAEEKRRQQGLH